MSAIPDRPLYPECHVRLIGEDGNALVILGRVRKALYRHLKHDRGWDARDVEAECDRFLELAKSGDYDNLLRVCMSWVCVE